MQRLSATNRSPNTNRHTTITITIDIRSEQDAQGQNDEGVGMKSKAQLVAAVGLLCAVAVFGQEAAVPLPPPATDTIAPDIPGVVKGSR